MSEGHGPVVGPRCPRCLKCVKICRIRTELVNVSSINAFSGLKTQGNCIRDTNYVKEDEKNWDDLR